MQRMQYDVGMSFHSRVFDPFAVAHVDKLERCREKLLAATSLPRPPLQPRHPHRWSTAAEPRPERSRAGAIAAAAPVEVPKHASTVGRATIWPGIAKANARRRRPKKNIAQRTARSTAAVSIAERWDTFPRIVPSRPATRRVTIAGKRGIFCAIVLFHATMNNLVFVAVRRHGWTRSIDRWMMRVYVYDLVKITVGMGSRGGAVMSLALCKYILALERA